MNKIRRSGILIDVFLKKHNIQSKVFSNLVI